MHINIENCILGGVLNETAKNCVHASVWYKISRIHTRQCLVHKSIVPVFGTIHQEFIHASVWYIRALCQCLVQNSVLVLKAGASAPSP